jgi:hypothetical protein
LTANVNIHSLQGVKQTGTFDFRQAKHMWRKYGITLQARVSLLKRVQSSAMSLENHWISRLVEALNKTEVSSVQPMGSTNELSKQSVT